MPIINIVIPTTPERSERLKELVVSIQENTKDMEYRILPFENELGGWVPAVYGALEYYGFKDDELVVLLGSDVVVKEGWLSTLWDAFIKRFPDGDGAAQPFDEINHGMLCQHPLAKVSTIKKYLDPRFVHNFSDNWMTDCLNRDMKYLYVPKSKIEHKHFINGKAQKDKTYETVFNAETMKKDETLYSQLVKEFYKRQINIA